MAFRKVGSEFQVNTTYVDSQFSSSLAALANGRFVITWDDLSAVGGDASAQSARGQIFNADGSKSGEEFLVNTTTFMSQFNPSVSGFTDGRFVTVWTDASATGADTSSFSVRGQIFNGDGSKTGGEFLVNTTTFDGQFYGRVAVLAGGGFVAIWGDASATGADTSGYAVRGQVFGANGSKIGGEFLANTTTAGHQSPGAVAALADGGFVATWDDASATGGDTSGRAVRGQLFNADGTKRGGEFLANTTTAFDQYGSSIAVLADGHFVVTWSDLSTSGIDTSSAAFRGQIFNSDGTKSGGEFLVNSTTTGAQGNGSVTALADGRFVATWTDSSASGDDTSGDAVRGQVFLADGTKDGPEFLVNAVTLNNQSIPQVIARPDGSFVVSWTDSSHLGSDQDGSAVRAQIFDATTYFGTAASEAITGGSFGDFLYGGAGSDVLNGASGNDHLYGGLDSDTLIGGDGFDLVRYDDRNYGNLVIRLDAPNLNTGAAAGDTFSSIEGIVGGYGSDTIVGDGNLNQLYGHAGIDFIYGNGGNDRLDGGLGDDNLWGGAGADTLIGGDGFDIARYDDFTWGNITVRLDAPSLNTNVAAGDTFVSIEGIYAGAGSDTVVGDAGGNVLAGLGGNDFLFGLDGNDSLVGGAGADRFYFITTPNAATNMDTIVDFEVGIDKIMLDRAVFPGLTAGTLQAGAFNTGMAASEADDRIIYNAATGALLFDVDGASAVNGAVQFAVLSSRPAGVSASDFIVI